MTPAPDEPRPTVVPAVAEHSTSEEQTPVPAGLGGGAGRSETSARHARQLRRSVITLLVVGACVVGLVLAVPGLHGVQTTLRHANPWWIAVAVVLEVLSNVGYQLVVMLVFPRAPAGLAARLAWSESAFGAAVALGGAGSLALGAWVLHDVGMPAARIAERTAVSFLATSGINVIVLSLFGCGLAVGALDGPSNPLLSVAPGIVGVATLAFFLVLPRYAERGALRLRSRPRLAGALRGAAVATEHTKDVVFARDWRVVGAPAYLLCDITVLWVSFRALGDSPPFAAVVLAYQIGYLANIIPAPGGIGPLDAGLVAMLVLYGAKATIATAAVLIYHAIALWIPTLIGTLAFISLRRRLAGVRVAPQTSDPGT